jgi:phosphoglycolate phosphatase
MATFYVLRFTFYDRLMPAVFVVFDLDGTLIDGYEAIGDALAYAMERFGLPALPPEKVRVMVGHGIEKLLEEAVGEERASEGVRLFRERYPEVAVAKSRLMPGVREALASRRVSAGWGTTIAWMVPRENP